MPKKRVSGVKKAVRKRTSKSDKIEKTLAENLVALQKVHINLIEKFDKLSEQISKLLGLFEIAALTVSESPSSVKATEKDRDFIEKINSLLEQNKTIAKGLTIMEEKLREKVYGQVMPQEESGQMPPPPQPKRPLPRF
jgi:lipid II:glycine glycyltransferase (peptidoglycan interpeptide bridge formation enzyme)